MSVLPQYLPSPSHSPFRQADVLLWESTCHPCKHGTVLTTLDRKPGGDSPHIASNISHLCALTLARPCRLKVPLSGWKKEKWKEERKNKNVTKV